jgi:hypothetical protein
MSSSPTVERIRHEARKELQRAVRDFPAVEIVETDGNALAISGDDESVRQVKRALWTRELSAEDYGQETLAEADASARAQLDRAT